MPASSLWKFTSPFLVSHLVACYVKVKQRSRDTSPLLSDSAAPLWPSPPPPPTVPHTALAASPAFPALTPGRKHLGLTTAEGGSNAIFQKEMDRGIPNDA